MTTLILMFQKGYEYTTSLNDEISESRSYNFKRESSNNKAKYWIRYFRYFEGQTNAKTNISWQTARQNDYVLIKDQIKSSVLNLLKQEIMRKLSIQLTEKEKFKFNYILGTLKTDLKI